MLASYQATPRLQDKIWEWSGNENAYCLWLDFLLIRKDYGLHRTTAPSSLLPTRVHPSTVSVHLGSREGLQLASSPLIAWTVTASATVTEKVRSGRLMLQWSPITCTCTSVQSFIYVHIWVYSWLHVYVCGQSSYNLRTEPTSVLVVTSSL